MNDTLNPYRSWGLVAADAGESERARFIRLTYLHLLGAVLAFAGLEALLLGSPVGEQLTQWMLSGGQLGWLLVIAGFVGISWLAQSWAQSSASKPVQYAGLGLYVVAEAVIFVPLLTYAARMNDQVIPMAGFLTLFVFGGLTAIVFLTGADFSFLGTGLRVAMLAALVVAAAAMIFGFTLGLLFTAALILLAAGYILYETSNVLHRYQTGQYVAASLALFAAVALMFWYMIQLVMSLQSRD